ncbi:MAG: DUF1203 domain-containing protein [Acidimicrobiales bacterium]
MTPTHPPIFRILAISPEEIEKVRKDHRDVSDRPAVQLRANGGEPLRCCLRNATSGDEILLFGYEPRLPAASPYREIGAVYVHAKPCAGWVDESVYPSEWQSRPQVLRAYDCRGWIHPSTSVHDGSDPEAAISAVLENPEVVEVHSRNLAYGCFMFVARRG